MPTALTNHVAGEIRAEMARQKVSQVEVASALGMSQPVLSRMLSGERDLTLDFVERVCEVLDVPLGQLMDGRRDEFRISPVIGEYAMLGVA